MQVAKLVIANMTARNSAISLQILFAESVEMPVIWHETVPTDSEVPTHEMLCLVAHLKEELAREMLSIEKWRTLCKSCLAHQPAVDLRAISRAVKVVTIQLDTVLHQRTPGIDQLHPQVQLHGHAIAKNVEDTNKLHHGNNHGAMIAITLMLRLVVRLLLGNNKHLHLPHLKIMATVATNKAMVKMATRRRRLLLHLLQQD